MVRITETGHWIVYLLSAWIYLKFYTYTEVEIESLTLADVNVLVLKVLPFGFFVIVAWLNRKFYCQFQIIDTRISIKFKSESILNLVLIKQKFYAEKS